MRLCRIFRTNYVIARTKYHFLSSTLMWLHLWWLSLNLAKLFELATRLRPCSMLGWCVVATLFITHVGRHSSISEWWYSDLAESGNVVDEILRKTGKPTFILLFSVHLNKALNHMAIEESQLWNFTAIRDTVHWITRMPGHQIALSPGWLPDSLQKIT